MKFTVGLIAVVGMVQATRYKSGAVTGYEKFTYGKFITRMQAPDKKGTVSSFFTYWNGPDFYPGGWNELDLEIVPSVEKNPISMNIIYGDGHDKHESHDYKRSFDPKDDWHIYEMAWTPEYIAWSIDNQEVRRVKSTDPSVDFMSKGQSVMMNFWTPTFESWGKGFDAVDMPWYVKYDYVETYTWNSETSGFDFHWRDDFTNFDTDRWHKSDNTTFDANSTTFRASQAFIEHNNLVLKMEPEAPQVLHHGEHIEPTKVIPSQTEPTYRHTSAKGETSTQDDEHYGVLEEQHKSHMHHSHQALYAPAPQHYYEQPHGVYGQYYPLGSHYQPLAAELHYAEAYHPEEIAELEGAHLDHPEYLTAPHGEIHTPHAAVHHDYTVPPPAYYEDIYGAGPYHSYSEEHGYAHHPEAKVMAVKDNLSDAIGDYDSLAHHDQTPFEHQHFDLNLREHDDSEDEEQNSYEHHVEALPVLPSYQELLKFYQEGMSAHHEAEHHSLGYLDHGYHEQEAHHYQDRHHDSEQVYITPLDTDFEVPTHHDDQYDHHRYGGEYTHYEEPVQAHYYSQHYTEESPAEHFEAHREVTPHHFEQMDIGYEHDYKVAEPYHDEPVHEIVHHSAPDFEVREHSRETQYLHGDTYHHQETHDTHHHEETQHGDIHEGKPYYRGDHYDDDDKQDEDFRHDVEAHAYHKGDTYGHDVDYHKGAQLMHDIEHEYDELFHEIESETKHGVEHHDTQYKTLPLHQMEHDVPHEPHQLHHSADFRSDHHEVVAIAPVAHHDVVTVAPVVHHEVVTVAPLAHHVEHIAEPVHYAEHLVEPVHHTVEDHYEQQSYHYPEHHAEYLHQQQPYHHEQDPISMYEWSIHDLHDGRIAEKYHRQTVRDPAVHSYDDMEAEAAEHHDHLRFVPYGQDESHHEAPEHHTVWYEHKTEIPHHGQDHHELSLAAHTESPHTATTHTVAHTTTAAPIHHAMVPHSVAPVHHQTLTPVHHQAQAPHGIVPAHYSPHAQAPVHLIQASQAQPAHVSATHHAQAPVHTVPVHTYPVHAAPVHAAPVHATQVHGTPVHAALVHGAPVHATPVHAAPVHATPVHAAPVHATPVHTAPVHAAPVHHVQAPVHHVQTQAPHTATHQVPDHHPAAATQAPHHIGAPVSHKAAPTTTQATTAKPTTAKAQPAVAKKLSYEPEVHDYVHHMLSTGSAFVQ